MLMTPLAVLAVLGLMWDVSAAGHVAQLRASPPLLAALSGLVALLVAPAVVLVVAGGGGIDPGAGALWGVAWIWPATVTLCAAQAAYVSARRIAPPAIAIPVLVYDVLLVAVAIVRSVGGSGSALPTWAITLGAAYVAALGHVAGPAALASPYTLLVPLVAPAYRPRRGTGRTLRIVVAATATAWVALTAAALPGAARAVASYEGFSAALPERIPGDFTVGLDVLPPVVAAPTQEALRADLALADSVQAEAVGITIDPIGARAGVLDSIARAFEGLRRDSTLLIVTLGSAPGRSLLHRSAPRRGDSVRIADVARVASRLRPDYLVLADDPAEATMSPAGRQMLDLIAYFTASAATAHGLDARIRVALSVSGVTGRDSALFDWAAQPGSPMDAVGFVVYPGFDGARSIEGQLHVAERWMRRFPYREYWVFAVGGYPIAHGEASQLRAIEGTLGWAAAHPQIKGVLVAQAGDYGGTTGLRAPTGRLRPAVDAVVRAARAVRGDTMPGPTPSAASPTPLGASPTP